MLPYVVVLVHTYLDERCKESMSEEEMFPSLLLVKNEINVKIYESKTEDMGYVVMRI